MPRRQKRFTYEVMNDRSFDLFNTVLCCYFKTAVTEFASHHAEAKSAGWCSLVVRNFVIHAGRGRSRRDGGMHPPHQPFSNMFLMNTVFP